MPASKVFTATDLLDQIFDFTEMTPDKLQWNEPALKNNPPRLVRLQRIESLLSAFFEQKITLLEKTKQLFTGKKINRIENFLAGDFIKDRDIKDYDEVIFFINKFVDKQEQQVGHTNSIRVHHLVHTYQQLLKYKRQIRNLLTFNDGWIEASSVTARFSIYLTDSISSNLVGKYRELDTVLQLIIAPGKQSFTNEQLEQRCGFPLDDLQAIDMDFM